MNKITMHKTKIPADKFIAYNEKTIYDEEDYYFEEIENALYYNGKCILWGTDDDYPVFSYKFELSESKEEMFYSREGIDGYYKKDYIRKYDKFIDSNARPYAGIKRYYFYNFDRSYNI